MSAQLQRSLLTALPQPDDLQLVGRYQPAAKDQQIGGDWYDAFTVADGGTCLVVGDVTGHDRSAAVSMAQLRNILRGVGYAYAKPPARVLETLDKAIRDLELGALATAVLARVEQTDGQHEANVRLLRWSNAGHTPPLRPGSTVLMFTDGLVERRRGHLSDGLDWLRRAVEGLATHQMSLDELCDDLLAQVGDDLEDDVAILALRAHPQDGPRPG